jgi:hypothetical protein
MLRLDDVELTYVVDGSSWSNRPPSISGSISVTSPLVKSCATRKVGLDGGL